jgi:WhiB family transcriptional regulator, redox-sensing transcriptional regulator
MVGMPETSRNTRGGGGDWRLMAACRDLDPATLGKIFYPKGNSKQYEPWLEAGKKLCHECPVESDCLAYAINEREEYGTWGGFDEWERRHLISNGTTHLDIVQAEKLNDHNPEEHARTCTQGHDGRRCKPCQSWLTESYRPKFEKVCELESCKEPFVTGREGQRFHTTLCARKWAGKNRQNHRRAASTEQKEQAS